MGSLLVIMVERRRLGCAERPSEGGGAHAQRGGESCRGRDQSSVKPGADPGPWFSGKRLGHRFRAPQLSRISRDTILKAERGEHSTEAASMHACTHTNTHTYVRTRTHAASLFPGFLFHFALSHTKPTNSWEEVLQPLPHCHGNGISHI